MNNSAKLSNAHGRTVRTLSLVLALVMIFSCFGAQVFAADADNVKHYDSMVVLGDSITRGCGLDGYDSYASTGPLEGLPGSAPAIIADKCLNDGAKRCFCTFQGETLASMLCMLGLEDESSDSFLTDSWFADAIFPRMKQFCGSGTAYDVKENLKTAELIVIELGMSDIFYRSKEISNLQDAFADGTDALLESIPVLLKEILYGCNYVMANYHKLLDFIKENNPNADVVVMGLYNMFSGLAATDEIILPLGDVESIVSGTVNVYLKNIAAKYGYMYADITNVPTPIIEQNLALTNMGDMNAAVHPSIENGLPYIARQVINVLPEQEATPVKSKTTINVDMGFVKHVDYVMVDGIKVKNFSVSDDGVLTVPYLSRFAKTLTVAVVGDNGKVTVQLYQLSYNNGYTAYRILSNSDIMGAGATVLRTFTGTAKTIFGSLLKK